MMGNMFSRARNNAASMLRFVGLRNAAPSNPILNPIPIPIPSKEEIESTTKPLEKEPAAVPSAAVPNNEDSNALPSAAVPNNEVSADVPNDEEPVAVPNNEVSNEEPSEVSAAAPPTPVAVPKRYPNESNAARKRREREEAAARLKK